LVRLNFRSSRFLQRSNGGRESPRPYPRHHETLHRDTNYAQRSLHRRNPGGNLTLGSTLGNEGTANLDIGGSFDVASTTATGNYSGTFTVSVNYN
jgi:hypothetical protein